MSNLTYESSHAKDRTHEGISRDKRSVSIENEESSSKRKKDNKKNAESNWMLPSVNARLTLENDSKSKDKKHKKKKSKKKNKKKSKKSSGSDDESSEDEWVEKSPDHGATPEKTVANKPEAVGEVRDEWMSMPGLFPSVTKERKQPKKRDDTEQTILNTMGQSKYELNPYWKSGGTGLPTEEKDSPGVTVGTVGDLGADWLRRALTRAKEQAKEEGRSLEEVAAERWGTLSKLETMLAEAEAKCTNRNRPQQRPSKQDYRNHRPDRQHDNYQATRNNRDGRREEGGRSREKDDEKVETFQRPKNKDSDDDYDDKFSTNRFKKLAEDEGDSRKNVGRGGSNRDQKDPDRSRMFQRPRNDDDDRNASSRFKRLTEDEGEGRRGGGGDGGDSDRSRMFQRPRNDDDDRGDSSTGSRFRKPKDDDRSKDRHRGDSYRSTARHEPSWRRKEFVESKRESPTRSELTNRAQERSESTNRTEDRSVGKRREKRRESPTRSESINRMQEKRRDSREKSQETATKVEKVSGSSDAKGKSTNTGGSLHNAGPSKQASSDSDDSDEPMEAEAAAVKVSAAMTDKEMNDLGAKLVKAEIMGNETLAAELKQKLDAARAHRATAPLSSRTAAPASATEEVVVLTRTDARGTTRPVAATPEWGGGGRKKKGKVETHNKEGQRVRYFPDDDNRSLKEMFESEKLNTVEDSNKMFSEMASKIKPNDDMADIFEDRACREESAGKRDTRERGLAISESRRNERVLDTCNMCLESKRMLKHLVIAIGTKAYLSLPPLQSLTEGHCYIVPLHHSTCSTQLDEDVWTEVQNFRRALTKMFVEMDMDCVFVETAMALRKFPHMWLECIPMPTETGHMAPIFFKKAILECETEWSTNRKLVETNLKDVRRSIPKGLPYFSVDFGNQGGYAHVIEEESAFPRNFAQEIVGGMMDLDHGLWRKPQRESFDSQRKKVLQFAQWWKPHDITAGNTNRSDSDSSD